MQASIRALFPRFYDPATPRRAARYIGELDLALIEDGTYYVHEAGGEIVACGGWSQRNRLYTGSGAAADDGRLLDPATEPARVRAMFVRDDWTRRGLGRAILERASAAAQPGFTQMALMATLPGEPLYRAYGFVETSRTMVRLPDGTELDGVAMERPIAPDEGGYGGEPREVRETTSEGSRRGGRDRARKGMSGTEGRPVEVRRGHIERRQGALRGLGGGGCGGWAYRGGGEWGSRAAPRGAECARILETARL